MRSQHFKALCIILGMTLVFSTGCGDPGIAVRQDVTLRVTDSESGQPVKEVNLYKISEPNLSILPPLSNDELFAREEAGNQVPVVTDDSGNTVVSFGGGFLCIDRPSALGDSCDKIATQDFITGTVQIFGVAGGTESEILTGTISPDQEIVGDLFTIRVISISEPQEDS